MAKVNWKAKNDYEFIQNLRILQDAFKKIGIKRYVEVYFKEFRSKNWQGRSIKTISSLPSGLNGIMTSTAATGEIIIWRKNAEEAITQTLDSRIRMLCLRPTTAQGRSSQRKNHPRQKRQSLLSHHPLQKR
jgi:hypothetical protein